MGDIGGKVQFLDGEDALKEGMQPTPVFLPGEFSQGQKSMGLWSPRVRHNLGDLARMHSN